MASDRTPTLTDLRPDLRERRDSRTYEPAPGNENPNQDRLLTAEEAGDLLQVSAYTMRDWARAGRVPAMRIGRGWRFNRRSLLQWVADQERGG